MAELGSFRNIKYKENLISLADGYSPPTGTSGNYDYVSYSYENEKGNLFIVNASVFQSIEPLIRLITYYLMRGKDIDCGVITYRVWISPNAPDTTGALYTGTRCGATPLTDIVVTSQFT